MVIAYVFALIRTHHTPKRDDVHHSLSDRLLFSSQLPNLCASSFLHFRAWFSACCPTSIYAGRSEAGDVRGIDKCIVCIVVDGIWGDFGQEQDDLSKIRRRLGF